MIISLNSCYNEKICKQKLYKNQNTQFKFSNLSSKIMPFSDNVKNILQPDRPQMATWRIRNARWIPKTTNTHSEYVIFIDFPQRQWLLQNVSVSSYM